MSLQIICAAAPAAAGHLIHGPAIIRHRNWNATGNGRGNVNENGDDDDDGAGNACNKFLVWNNLRINCLTFPTQTKTTTTTKKQKTKATAQLEPKNKFRLEPNKHSHTRTRDHHMPARTTIDRCNKFPHNSQFSFFDYKSSKRKKMDEQNTANKKKTNCWLTYNIAATNLSSSLF